MSEPLLRVDRVCKSYEGGAVSALRGLSFEVAAGEVVALTGPSGCGKSTLLSLIGLLDRPSEGEITVASQRLGDIVSPYDYRARTVGFVFQDHHLLPAMTLLENVEAPMIALHVPRAERRWRAMAMLANMGLEHRAGFLPAMVSGGERQRAAVARALANGPRLLLADEPTGNLDSENGARVIELFMSHAREQSLTVLMATHNPDIAAWADRNLAMRDGRMA